MNDEEKALELSKLKYQGRDWDQGFYKTNVYSELLLNDYLTKLRISDPQGRKEMQDSILAAAMYYETMKRSHLQSYRSTGHTERNLKATLKPVQKLRKQLNNITDNSMMDVHPLLEATKELVRNGEYPQQASRFVEAFYWREGDGYRFDWHGLISFLDFYETACEKAINEKIRKNGAHKNKPIETWLFNLKRAWETYSPIPFIAGKYHDGVGYNSEAIHIMKAMIAPLDDTVQIQTIATKLIELNRNPP